MLNLTTSSDVKRKGLKNSYHFEEAWLQNDGCAKVVDNIWHKGGSMEVNLAWVREELVEWGKDTFGKVPKIIKKF